MQNVASKDLSERELELLRRATELERALAVTLDYIQSELQPNPPANIAQYRDLLAPKSGGVTYDAMGEFLDVVTSMARFLSSSSAMEVFSRKDGIGFLDWIALATMDAQPPGFTDRQLTHFIGANLKRTQHLVGRLSSMGMVKLTPGKKIGTSNIQITPLGQSRVGEINAELMPLLKSAVHWDPSHLLLLVSLIRRFSRIHDLERHRTANAGDASSNGGSGIP